MIPRHNEYWVLVSNWSKDRLVGQFDAVTSKLGSWKLVGGGWMTPDTVTLIRRIDLSDGVAA